MGLYFIFEYRVNIWKKCNKRERNGYRAKKFLIHRLSTENNDNSQNVVFDIKKIVGVSP